MVIFWGEQLLGISRRTEWILKNWKPFREVNECTYKTCKNEYPDTFPEAFEWSGMTHLTKWITAFIRHAFLHFNPHDRASIPLAEFSAALVIFTFKIILIRSNGNSWCSLLWKSYAIWNLSKWKIFSYLLKVDFRSLLELIPQYRTPGADAQRPLIAARHEISKPINSALP